MQIKIRVISKAVQDDCWTGVFENLWIPQNAITITLPFPEDVKIGEEVTLTLSK